MGKQLRILTRSVLVKDNEVLLVRNKNCDFWYFPGGGWEYDNEDILECIVREVKEETGYLVTVDKMIAAQEFHDSPEKVFFETFWLVKLDKNNKQTKAGLKKHRDLDPHGIVEECRWYDINQLDNLKLYPKPMKDIKKVINKEDSFLGVFD